MFIHNETDLPSRRDRLVSFLVSLVPNKDVKDPKTVYTQYFFTGEVRKSLVYVVGFTNLTVDSPELYPFVLDKSPVTSGSFWVQLKNPLLVVPALPTLT